jgi:hypothetical protein
MTSRLRNPIRHDLTGGLTGESTVSRSGKSRRMNTQSQAIGTLALGAVAFGALAVGAVAIGRLAVGRARIRRLEIDELVVQTLRITGEIQVPPKPDPES